MAERKIYIEIDLDDPGARSKLLDLDKITDKLGTTASKTSSGGLSLLHSTLLRNTLALSGAVAGGTLLAGVIGGTVRSAVTTLTGVFTEAIAVSTRYTNSFIGLSSVANAFGQDADAARSAAIKLASDGLISVTEAAEGLKNLLATRFELPQAIRLMEAFKDSAAFNRQGMLELGQAVVGATQGIKNQMSQMVDNAGVTKNLTNILKEQGLKVSDLSRLTSDARVRQALYAGILKETAAQTGDAARLTQTYTGQLQRMRTSWDNLLATWGSAVTENRTVAEALKAVSDVFVGLNLEATRNGQAWTTVSDIVIRFIRVLAGFTRGLDTVQLAAHGLHIVNLELAAGVVNLAGIVVRATKAFIEYTRWTNPATWFGAGKQALADMEGQLEGLEGAYDKLTASSEAAAARSITLGNTLQTGAAKLDRLADSLEKTRGQTVEYGAAQRQVTDTTNGAADAADKAGKSNVVWGDGMAYALGWMQRLTAESQKLELRNTDPIAKIFDFEPDYGMDSFERALELRSDALRAFHAKWDGTIADVLDFEMDPQIPAITQEMEQAARTIKGTLKSALHDLPSIIMGAIQGGGSIGGAIGGLFGSSIFGKDSNLVKTLTSGLTKVLGGTIGGALGSIIPGLGTLAGSFIGKGIGSLFGKLFGGEGRKVNDLRDQFTAAAGGIDKLAERAAAAGTTLAEFYRADTIKEYEAAIANLEAAFAAADARARALAEATAAVNDEFGPLFESAEGLGIKLPESIQLSIDKLLEQGLLTDENAAKLRAMADGSEVDYRRMEEAAKRYGLEEDKLGTAFQQAKTHEQYRQIINDYDLLVRGGADAGAVINAMADEINNVVAKSLKFGTEIPENMRPMIEALFNSGQLVDENGEKMADLTRLKFGAPVETEVERIIGAIERLITRLEELPGLFAAAQRAGEGLGVDAGSAEGPDFPGTRPPSVETPASVSSLTATTGARILAFAPRSGTVSSLPRSGAVPAAAGAGLVVEIGDIHVGGDLGISEDEMARRISQKIVSRMKQKGVRFSRTA